MDKVRVGIVGAGFASHIHIDAYKRNYPLYEVVGVTSFHTESARKLAERYGISVVFNNYSELASSPDVDVVDVCVPTNVHEDVIIKAAENRKHIICEKPLTGYFGEDMEDVKSVGRDVRKEHMLRKVVEKANRIEEVVRESGVKFMYAENFVYAPAVTKAKRLISVSGAPLIEIRAEESHSGSHASYSRRWRTSGGGSLLRMGSHPVGVVLHLKHFEGILKYGKPINPRYVFAEVGELTRIDSVKEEEHYFVTDWEDVEDWSLMVITFEDGTKATVFSTDVSLGGVKNLIEIYTSKGVIYANITPNDMMMVYTPDGRHWGDEYIAEKIETKSGWSFPFPDEDWARGYPQEMADFAASIMQGKEPNSGLLLALQTAKIIYAGYLSAEEGIRVDVSDIL